MHCVIPFLCAAFLSTSHPYTDPASPMKVSGSHKAIGGMAYVNRYPAYTVEGPTGERYPVYLYPR
jgi:hypothetical protein